MELDSVDGHWESLSVEFKLGKCWILISCVALSRVELSFVGWLAGWTGEGWVRCRVVAAEEEKKGGQSVE